MRLRIITIVLSTGEVEKLVTNVMDESFTNQDFKELYFKRWGIETKYNQLKSKFELENFSGANVIGIEQDFYAAIYLLNLMAIAKSEANENVHKETVDLKYEYKVNMNIMVAKMTTMLIKCFYEDDPKIRGLLFDKTMQCILKNLVPIRPKRSFPRREPSRKTKYPMNKKRSL